MKILVCPNCGWNMGEGIGMKPECPDCKTHLNLLSGTREEIEKYINEKKDLKKSLEQARDREISKKTLASMDKSAKNFKAGKVGDPINLDLDNHTSLSRDNINWVNIGVEQDLRALWGDLLIDTLLEYMDFKGLLKWINEPNEWFDKRTPKEVAWVDGTEHIWELIEKHRVNGYS